tara:strand:- start:357 stop:506 length:150 start_codon:yes stop_codon:yes gene_type:complete
MKKNFFLTLSILIFISACGGSSGTNSLPTTQAIGGMQGDVNAIEPVDLD